MPAGVKQALQARGHDAVTSRDIQAQRADDAGQLFTAAQRGSILVTHNRQGFELLQHAWRRWPSPIDHSGILVIPQRPWTAAETAAELRRFVRSVQPLTNDLYRWSPSRGWVRFH